MTARDAASRAVLVVVGLTLAIGGTAMAGTAAPSSGTNQSSGSWTVYHGDARGDGATASVTSVDLTGRAWTSPVLDGQIYGEPLAADGHVYVASENDTVYALSAATGAVVWSAHVGAPVPSSALPCGNITPTVGITGTPVVDAARREVFVVADELVGGHPAHELVGLDSATGKVEVTQGVDPPGATPAALLQRTGLALDGGRVVFGFGGNYGDCPTYHGWVVSVPETGGSAQDFAVDSGAGESQGAVWMGGAAPVVDAAGNIWVEAGNGSVTTAGSAYDNSDSVLELSPALALRQYFAPASWASQNGRDQDLSTAPALLDDGEVVAAGKDGSAYLLDGARLGGIGGEQSSVTRACAQDIDGGAAVVGTTVYLPCRSGPVAVQVSSGPSALHLLWRAAAGGGPPIAAAGLVWTIGQDGTLYALSATTGAVVEQARIGTPANHFATPSIGSGLLLAPGVSDVVAFRTSTNNATTGSTTSPAPVTSTTKGAASPKATGSSGGTPVGGIVAAVVAALAVASGATVLWRRNRGRAGAS